MVIHTNNSTCQNPNQIQDQSLYLAFRYVQRAARRKKGCSLRGRRRKGRGRRGVRKASISLPLSLPPYPFRHLLCRPTGRTNMKTCPVPLPYLFICDASLVLSESLKQNMISMEKIIPIETSLPLCQSLLTVSSANLFPSPEYIPLSICNRPFLLIFRVSFFDNIRYN